MHKYSLHTLTKLALIILTGVAIIQPAQSQVTGLSDFEIFLDPGHSQKENMGLYNYTEAEKVLRVALQMKSMFENQTDIAAVHMSRSTDADYITLSGRSDLANSLGADFYYSIHSNASAASDVFTMYGGWKNNGVVIEKTPKGGAAYGDILHKDMAGATRLPIHGMGNYPDRVFYYPNDYTHENQWPYLSVNRRTNMASILSETGSHTNSVQQQLNVNAKWRKLEALAAFRSFLQYKGVDRPAIGVAAGVITDAKTGVPINGVTVTIGDQTYTTDTYESLFHEYSNNPDQMHNGFYWIEGLTPEQVVDVVFTSDNYLTKTVQLTIASNPNGRTAENISFLDVELINSIPSVVTSVESANGMDNVMPGVSVKIVFSREMNRSTVEDAVSVSPDASLSFSWEDDFTLIVNTNGLDYETNYTLYIDGSIAKNTESDQFLDGDNDGIEGGTYQVQLTTAAQDLTAPVVVDKWPSETEYSTDLRPVIRLVFDEEISETALSESSIVVTAVNGGTVYAGTLSHTVAGDNSVLHLFLNENLVDKENYNVHISGIEDLYDNIIDDIDFAFNVNALAVNEITYIDTFNLGIAGWNKPTSDFINTKGIVRDATTIEYEQNNACSMVGATPGSLKLNYEWVDGYSNPYIRAALSSSAAQKNVWFNKEDILQLYLFGDGSGNQYRFMLRDGNGNSEGSEWFTIDWKGWKLLSWDLNNDPVIGWSSGNGVLDGTDFYFDGIHFQKGDNGALKGAVYFDDLRYLSSQSTGIDVYSVNVSLNVYPNPTSGQIIINASTIINRVEFYNMTGQKVMVKDYSSPTVNISLEKMSSGVYLIKVITNDGVVNSKVKLIR